MSTSDVGRNAASGIASVKNVDMKLEAVVIPFSDVDRAKQFYWSLGWSLDADFPFGLKNYWKSSNVAELSDDAIDTMISFMESAPSMAPTSRMVRSRSVAVGNCMRMTRRVPRPSSAKVAVTVNCGGPPSSLPWA